MKPAIPRHRLFGQLFRFAVVGASNLFLTYLVYLLCLLILQPVFSILVATFVGTVYTVLLNINVVFEKRISRHSVLVYLLYYVLYCALYAALLDAAIRFFSVPAPLAPIPVLCVVLPIHFLCSRFLLMRIAPRTDSA